METQFSSDSTYDGVKILLQQDTVCQLKNIEQHFIKNCAIRNSWVYFWAKHSSLKAH